MEPSPQKKQLVRSLAIVLFASLAGLVSCIVGFFVFGVSNGWVESQRALPKPDPVYYKAALEIIHYACFCSIPAYGVFFLLIAINVWLLLWELMNVPRLSQLCRLAWMRVVVASLITLFFVIAGIHASGNRLPEPRSIVGWADTLSLVITLIPWLFIIIGAICSRVAEIAGWVFLLFLLFMYLAKSIT